MGLQQLQQKQLAAVVKRFRIDCTHVGTRLIKCSPSIFESHDMIPVTYAISVIDVRGSENSRLLWERNVKQGAFSYIVRVPTILLSCKLKPFVGLWFRLI